jgi:hypothetical protein
MSRGPSTVSELAKKFGDEIEKQGQDLDRDKQLKLRNASATDISLWKKRWGLSGESDKTDVGETQARRIEEMETGLTPPPIPQTGPPPNAKKLPPMPKNGPSTGPPTGPPTTKTEKKTPPPKDDYVSKAFKSGINADMFHPDKNITRKQLEDLCLQYNFAMKQFSNTQEERMKELTASGMPLAGKRKTSDVEVTQLKTMIDFLWNQKEFEGTDRPEIPSGDQLRKDAMNWKPGTTEDKIKKYRATEIANVKVDVDHPKTALVTQESLAKANEELKKLGSFIRLVPAGKPDKDGFVPIRPEWNPDQKIKADHSDSHAKLLKLNQERQSGTTGSEPVGTDQLYVSWADCHRTAQSIMGSEDTASGIQDKEHSVIQTPEGEITVAPIAKQIIKEIPYASDHGANRAMHGLFDATMEKFKEMLIKEAGGIGKLSPTAKEVVEKIEKATSEKTDKKPANYRDAYRVISGDKDLYDKYSKTFGVNQYVRPKVGDALSQINDEAEKATSTEDYWNFHFAGVVLVNPDGSYMTLENLSVEDTEAVNDNWYFAVYDPNQGKDFHSVNGKDDHVGTRPLTMQFRKN